MRSLSKDDRTLFVRRYWNGEALNALAADQAVPAAKLAQKMYSLRQSLKKVLETEGLVL